MVRRGADGLRAEGKGNKQTLINNARNRKMAKANVMERDNEKVVRKGKRNRSRSKHPRVMRILKGRGPLLVENPKKILLMRGRKSSERGVSVLRDLNRLKNPFSKMFSKKNNITPFDDDSSLRFLCEKNDCSMFGMASHNKKRPHNIVLGRMFNWEVLDMIELGVDQYLGIDDIKGPKKALGNKPMLVFQGDEFEHSEPLKTLKSILMDLFRGQDTDTISVNGLDSVLVCSAHEGKCHLRWYFVNLEESDTKAPQVKLTNMGPFMDLSIRRCHVGAKEMRKTATRRPKQLVIRKQKNITRNEFGEKVGRVYKKRQQLDQLQTRKTKALKKRKVEEKSE